MTTISASNSFDGVFNDLAAENVSGLASGTAGAQDPDLFEIIVGDTLITLLGSGFSSYSGNFPDTGTITSLLVSEYNGSGYTLTATWTEFSVLASDLADWANAGDPNQGLADFLDGFFSGADNITGSFLFEDALYGYDGNDILNGGGGGADTLDGGAGDDIVYAFDESGGSFADSFNGGSGDEINGDTLRVFGDGLVDLTFATIANFERLQLVPFTTGVTNITASFLSSQLGGFASNLIVSGAGFAAVNQVNITMDGTNLDISGWQVGLNWSDSEYILIHGTSGADTIRGWEGQDQIGGGQGADVMYGGAGDDGFFGTIGGDGADHMYGGIGNDTYGIFDLGDVIHETPGGGSGDRAALWVDNYVVGANVENIQLYGDGSHQVFTATGNASANVMTGNTLANTLYGLGGADNLFGDDGDDTLIGGTGADALYGEGGNDTASYASATARVIASLTSGAGTAGDANGDTFFTIENLTGSSFDDVLTGDAGANRLTGGNGNDTLDGKAGVDTMIGGNGDDTYVVDVAGDSTTETSAAGGVDLVKSSVTRTLGANLENLTLTGSGAINGTGNTGANVITGNTKANTLSGMNGADTLSGGGGGDTVNGGGGHDSLTGGAGADKFVFNAAAKATNSDTIVDFSHAQHDKIQLENSVFTALGTGTGALAGAKFWASTTGAAHDADDRITYNTTTGQLYYDNDGNGSHAKILIATLTGHPALVASDIVVI